MIVEYHRVVTRRGAERAPEAENFLSDLLAEDLRIEPLTGEDALAAVHANLVYGAGNQRGGTLNFGDLMVYAVARRLSMPILCTGRDFPDTDALIHPASRRW